MTHRSRTSAVSPSARTLVLSGRTAAEIVAVQGFGLLLIAIVLLGLLGRAGVLQTT
ncbi:hypothetical protein [Brevundimonas sp.]|uniref:hypothetical protein n=1 Tax=Brevundimonas sp. TaxID=1871086 RepID=UPI002ABC3D88|nr:hypothetical protein [Brevundimonas sp.]MDZ4362365.1 hypothetical protein [Brevundimonas sp.]